MRHLFVIGFVTLTACGSVEEAEPDDTLDCTAVDGALACNSFESDDPEWMRSERDGIAVLDASALRAQVSAMGGKAVRAHSLAPVDRYYARFRANIPPGADTTGIALLHIGEASGMYLGTNVEIGGGKLGLAIQSANVYEYPLDVPADHWMCLELELVISETGGRAILRADGATVVDRSGLDTRPAGGIGQLEVGISYAGAAGAQALVDDVVVAGEPLPSCPSP
jgi:hypothetical protein